MGINFVTGTFSQATVLIPQIGAPVRTVYLWRLISIFRTSNSVSNDKIVAEMGTLEANEQRNQVRLDRAFEYRGFALIQKLAIHSKFKSSEPTTLRVLILRLDIIIRCNSSLV